MSVLILNSGNIGPFKSIEVKEDRLTCDGTDYPFIVIGEYQISEDDSLAPPPPVRKRSREDILAEIKELDLKRIRPLAEGETDRLAELNTQIAALREELNNV